MTSSAPTLSRKSLIDHIIGRLALVGFERAGEVFSKHVIEIQRGARVIINGQIMQQPDIEHHVLFEIELIGPGQVISEDGQVEDFELVQFRASTNDFTRDISVNIYYGKHSEFDRHLQTYFGIQL